MSARVAINEIANENDALKMEVAKARYSSGSNPPEGDGEESLSDAEKDEINTLMVENEELKKEVRKIRYAPPPSTSDSALYDQPQPAFTYVSTATPENVTDFDVADDLDEGFVEVEHEEDLLPLPRPKLPLQDQYDEEEEEVELDKGFHDEEGPVAETEAQSPSQAFQSQQPWIFQRLSDLVGSSNPYYGSSLFDHKVKRHWNLTTWAICLNEATFFSGGHRNGGQSQGDSFKVCRAQGREQQ